MWANARIKYSTCNAYHSCPKRDGNVESSSSIPFHLTSCSIFRERVTPGKGLVSVKRRPYIIERAKRNSKKKKKKKREKASTSSKAADQCDDSTEIIRLSVGQARRIEQSWNGINLPLAIGCLRWCRMLANFSFPVSVSSTDSSNIFLRKYRRNSHHFLIKNSSEVVGKIERLSSKLKNKGKYLDICLTEINWSISLFINFLTLLHKY